MGAGMVIQGFALAYQSMPGVLPPSDLLATYGVPGEQGHNLVFGFGVVPDLFVCNLQDLLQRPSDAASNSKQLLLLIQV